MNVAIETSGFEDIVRARAYALWEAEGRPAGRDAEHWRRSEDEARRALDDRALDDTGVVAKPAKAPARKRASKKAA